MTTLKAINDHVLIRMAPVKTKEGVIDLPTAAQERPNQGTIVSAGEGTPHPATGERIPMPVKEGDQVLIPGYAGTEIDDLNGGTLVLVTSAEIIAIIEEA